MCRGLSTHDAELGVATCYTVVYKGQGYVERLHKQQSTHATQCVPAQHLIAVLNASTSEPLKKLNMAAAWVVSSWTSGMAGSLLCAWGQRLVHRCACCMHRYAQYIKKLRNTMHLVV